MIYCRCVQRLRRRIALEEAEAQHRAMKDSKYGPDLSNGIQSGTMAKIDRTPSFYTTRSIVNFGGLSVADQVMSSHQIHPRLTAQDSTGSLSSTGSQNLKGKKGRDSKGKRHSFTSGSVPGARFNISTSGSQSGSGHGTSGHGVSGHGGGSYSGHGMSLSLSPTGSYGKNNDSVGTSLSINTSLGPLIPNPRNSYDHLSEGWGLGADSASSNLLALTRLHSRSFDGNSSQRSRTSSKSNRENDSGEGVIIQKTRSTSTSGSDSSPSRRSPGGQKDEKSNEENFDALVTLAQATHKPHMDKIAVSLHVPFSNVIVVDDSNENKDSNNNTTSESHTPIAEQPLIHPPNKHKLGRRMWQIGQIRHGHEGDSDEEEEEEEEEDLGADEDWGDTVTPPKFKYVHTYLYLHLLNASKYLFFLYIL